jgi:hypothetical protein
MPGERSTTQMREGRVIYCFSHIQKAAGTTLEVLLRRHFGVRHLLVNPPLGWTYCAADLAADLRLNPLVRSIAGHWLRPFTDFGRFESQLRWYTFLRDPIPRVLSHYQYHVEHMGVTRPLADWLRANPVQQNWQTRYLAGAADLDTARRTLEQRYAFVGLTERFDESLVLMRHCLGLSTMRLTYGKPHNVARSDVRKARVLEEFHAHRDVILELNALDLELYRFAVEQVYPNQIAAFGGQQLLSSSVREEAAGAVTHGKINEIMFLAYRRAVHRPMQKLRTRKALRRGDPILNY